MSERLSDAAVADALSQRTGWQFSQNRDAIEKTYKFTDFSEAFGFMTRAALVAEATNHHPDWTNVYNQVSVTLTTHEAGGVTARDLDLAAAMDRIAGS
ncbi:MAG: 4a-hydroxytetrahydrobiopterin dehydratase [Alphaproteobacteria bacterium]